MNPGDASKLATPILTGLLRVGTKAVADALRRAKDGPKVTKLDDLLGTPADYLSIVDTELQGASRRLNRATLAVVSTFLYRQSTMRVRLNQLIAATWQDWLDPSPDTVAALLRLDLLGRLQTDRRGRDLPPTPSFEELRDLELVVDQFVAAAQETGRQLAGKLQLTPEFEEVLRRSKPDASTISELRRGPTLPSAAKIEGLVEAIRRYAADVTGLLRMNFYDGSRTGAITECYVLPLLLGTGDHGPRPGDALARLARGGRWIVVGDPGAGKSSLCKRLSHMISTDNAFGLVLPIRAKARDLAGLSHVDRLESHFYSLISDRFADHLADEPPESRRRAFDLLLTHGNIVLIIDAIDEVVRVEQRESLCRAIERMAVGRPNLKIVVTSRLRENEVSPLGGFDVVRVMPLDWPRIAEIARASCRVRHRQDLEDRLIEALEFSAPEIGDLISNPLLLCLISSMFEFHEYIPSSRAEIYERATELFTLTWNKRKLGPGSVGTINNLVHDALGVVAAVVIDGEGSGGEGSGSAGATQRALVQALTQSFYGSKASTWARATELSEALIDNLQGRGWMLVTVDHGSDAISFQHRTFIEYYYAYQQVRTRSNEELAAWIHPLLKDTARWGVVVDLILLLLSRHHRLTDAIKVIFSNTAKNGTPEESVFSLAVLRSSRSVPVPFRELRQSLEVCLDTGSRGRLDREWMGNITLLAAEATPDSLDTMIEAAIDACIRRLPNWRDRLCFLTSLSRYVHDRPDLRLEAPEWLMTIKNIVRGSQLGYRDWPKGDLSDRLSMFWLGLRDAYGLLAGSGPTLLDPFYFGHQSCTVGAYLIGLMEDDYLALARGHPRYRPRSIGLLAQLLPRLAWPIDGAQVSLDGITDESPLPLDWPEWHVDVETVASEALVLSLLLARIGRHMDNGFMGGDMAPNVEKRLRRVGLGPVFDRPDDVMRLLRFRRSPLLEVTPVGLREDNALLIAPSDSLDRWMP